jgi:hypothetical protein
VLGKKKQSVTILTFIRQVYRERFEANVMVITVILVVSLAGSALAAGPMGTAPNSVDFVSDGSGF